MENESFHKIETIETKNKPGIIFSFKSEKTGDKMEIVFHADGKTLFIVEDKEGDDKFFSEAELKPEIYENLSKIMYDGY